MFLFSAVAIALLGSDYRPGNGQAARGLFSVWLRDPGPL